MKSKNNIARSMGTIHRHTKMFFNKQFSDLGLGSGGYIFMIKLNEKDGVTQNEITEMLHFDKAHTARMVIKLTDLGFVKKTQDENDKRSYRLFLTNKGKEIIPIIRESINNWNKILTSGFSAEEKKLLNDLLNKMAERSIKEAKSA